MGLQSFKQLCWQNTTQCVKFQICWLSCFTLKVQLCACSLWGKMLPGTLEQWASVQQGLGNCPDQNLETAQCLEILHHIAKPRLWNKVRLWNKNGVAQSSKSWADLEWEWGNWVQGTLPAHPAVHMYCSCRDCQCGLYYFSSNKVCNHRNSMWCFSDSRVLSHSMMAGMRQEGKERRTVLFRTLHIKSRTATSMHLFFCGWKSREVGRAEMLNKDRQMGKGFTAHPLPFLPTTFF